MARPARLVNRAAGVLSSLLPPAAGAMYMMLVGAAAIGLGARGRIDLRVLARHRWFFLAVGLLVGVNTNMGFMAMAYVDPGTAALLSRASIPFGVGLGVTWLRERLTPLEAAGALVAVAGVVTGAQARGWLVVAGTVNVVISRGLYYLAPRRLDMSLLTIALTLTPVLTWLFSTALFSPRVGPGCCAAAMSRAGGGGLTSTYNYISCTLCDCPRSSSSRWRSGCDCSPTRPVFAS